MSMKLLLASGNRHKLDEVAAILREAGVDIDLLGADAIGGMPDVAEDAGSFAGNARQKARALVDRVPAGTWVLADDSGLCVDYLKGAPGVISSRFAGPEASDGDNTRLLLDQLSGIPPAKRSAHFRCVLILVGPGGDEVLFDGRCSGRIAPEPSGDGGFGYDPVFVPDGHSVSFAELDAEEKNRISHRAVAMRQLVDWLRKV